MKRRVNCGAPLDMDKYIDMPVEPTECRPIETEKEYFSALRQIDSLMDAAYNTPQGDELDRLTFLVGEYERSKYAMDDDKNTGINPKDLVGATKPDISLVPSAGIIHAAVCMTDGARKYGPYNWRDPNKKVQAMTYLSAAMRHLLAYIDGEEEARDSGCSHLGHAIAGLCILLDAEACGTLVDNRPKKGGAPNLISRFTKQKGTSNNETP